jgi:hypothetical protein
MSSQDRKLTNHFTSSVPNSLPDTYGYCYFLAMHGNHSAMAIAVFARMLQECQQYGFEHKMNPYIQKVAAEN